VFCQTVALIAGSLCDVYLVRRIVIFLSTLAVGFVYGAKKGKILNMFIDDLSLPQPDEFGTQEVNEVCNTLGTFHVARDL